VARGRHALAAAASLVLDHLPDDLKQPDLNAADALAALGADMHERAARISHETERADAIGVCCRGVTRP
jgi:hypothetical protein